MSNVETTPIMIRAEITAEEWKDLRKLALEQGVTVQRLVGWLISEHLAGQANPS